MPFRGYRLDVVMVVEKQLPADPGSVSIARHMLDWLDGDIPKPVLEDFRLLISELVTNGIVHGPSEALGVFVDLSNHRLHAEVRQQGPGFQAAPKETDGSGSLEGRGSLEGTRSPEGTGSLEKGLHIVDYVANDWGIETARARVWFRLEW